MRSNRSRIVVVTTALACSAADTTGRTVCTVKKTLAELSTPPLAFRGVNAFGYIPVQQRSSAGLLTGDLVAASAAEPF